MPFYFLLIYRKWLIFAIYAKSFWVFREKLQRNEGKHKKIDLQINKVVIHFK